MLVVCETDTSNHLTENISRFFFVERSFDRSAAPLAKEFQEISSPHELKGQDNELGCFHVLHDDTA
jgi:hypothetical protein